MIFVRDVLLVKTNQSFFNLPTMLMRIFVMNMYLVIIAEVSLYGGLDFNVLPVMIMIYAKVIIE